MIKVDVSKLEKKVKDEVSKTHLSQQTLVNTLMNERQAQKPGSASQPVQPVNKWGQ